MEEELEQHLHGWNLIQMLMNQNQRNTALKDLFWSDVLMTGVSPQLNHRRHK